MASNPPERRRVRMVLDLHADDWDELTAALDGVQVRIAEAKMRGEATVGITSGGYSSGFRLDIDEDESVTGDSYRAALKAYCEGRR